MKKFFLGLLILSFPFGITKLNASETSPKFIRGSDTLIVYKDVPGLPPSNKFTIKVRSAATNNAWVEVFAHYTYNRALELPDINQADGGNVSTNVQHYPQFTGGWSHTYGNVEMSKNQPVEVEIASKNGFKIGGKDFFKAAVHPAQKVSAITVTDGKVYFTISNPAQVVIDINGQMDDYNAYINPIGHPLHTISLFTNPVLKKPSLNGSRVHYVEPGVMPTTNYASYDTLYFKPGVHTIGLNNKLNPGKKIYIPGDAIIYGAMNNLNVLQGSYATIGDRIRVYGYGTISGEKTIHPLYVSTTVDHNLYKPIMIDKALNYEIYGITIIDPANHSCFIPSGTAGAVRWGKVIGWRANSDGFAGNDNVDDCFMRTSDDASYVRGNKRRCTFWKDHFSAIFYMSYIPNKPLIIEDCDVVYLRSRYSDGTSGGLFNDRGSYEGSNLGGIYNTNVTFRNFRIHDKLANMCVFNMKSYEGANASAPMKVGYSFNGILFQNVSIAGTSVKQVLMGCAAAPWYGGLTFENVTFAGTKLTEQNFSTYFNTNEFVKDLVFKSTDYFTISNNTNPNNGFVAMNPTAPNFIADAMVRLTASPRPGFEFESWSGDASGATNPIDVVMNGNKTISANFKPVQTGTLSSSISSKDYIAVYPNPATDKLFYESAEMQVLKIEFVDLAGKIVYSDDAQKLNGSIDLKGIKSGLYLIKFHTDRSVYSKKVVIK